MQVEEACFVLIGAGKDGQLRILIQAAEKGDADRGAGAAFAVFQGDAGGRLGRVGTARSIGHDHGRVAGEKRGGQAEPAR